MTGEASKKEASKLALLLTCQKSNRFNFTCPLANWMRRYRPNYQFAAIVFFIFSKNLCFKSLEVKNYEVK